MENITEQVVRHLVSTNFENLPPAVVHTAKRHTLDTLGCMVFGQTSTSGGTAVNLVQELDEKPRATIAGNAKQTSYLLAALANGTTAHSWELDDRHLPSATHTSATVVSAALSAGEKVRASGKSFLSAVTLGQDIAGRLGYALRDSIRPGAGWHGTGSINTFGAVTVAGKIFNLNEGQMAHAFGLAGTQAMGMTLCAYHNDGKHFHAGKAAMSGVLAALLAEKGFTGGTKVFEGDGSSKGYLELVCPTPKPERLTGGLGKQYEYERANLKPYSCAGDMHTGIDAILNLKRHHKITPEEIEAINVTGFEIVPTHFDVPQPKTSSQALLSYQHCLTIALVHDEVMPQYFQPDKLGDPVYAKIRGKFSLSSDPKFGVGDLEKGATVEVVTKRGKFIETVLRAKGEAENPLTDDEVKNKFRRLASSALSKGPIEKIVDWVFRLEELPDVQELGTLLRPQ